MIRLFLYFLIALALGGVAAAWLGDDRGYVLINFNDYALETSVVALFIILMLAFSAFYVLFWAINAMNPWRIVRNRGGLFLSRGQATAETEKGLVQLTEQRYSEAYKTFIKNAKKSPTPLVNYLGAAEAAFQLGDETGVRFCLREANAYSADANIANGLLTARLEQKEKRYENAAAQLQALQVKHPNHTGVLRMLSRLYVNLGAWTELAALLPLLKKQKVLLESDYAILEQRVYRERLQKFNAEAGQLPQLDGLWESTPKALQKDEVVLGIYIHHLVTMGAYDRAQGVLIPFFKQNWSDSLISMLGYLDTSEPASVLVILEKLIKERPGNTQLALTLGRVSLRNRLWGKGREYFESALASSTEEKLSAEINAELARLYEGLGEHERSMVCYRNAMSLLEHKLPDLPIPD